MTTRQHQVGNNCFCWYFTWISERVTDQKAIAIVTTFCHQKRSPQLNGESTQQIAAPFICANNPIQQKVFQQPSLATNLYHWISCTNRQTNSVINMFIVVLWHWLASNAVHCLAWSFLLYYTKHESTWKSQQNLLVQHANNVVHAKACQWWLHIALNAFIFPLV